MLKLDKGKLLLPGSILLRNFVICGFEYLDRKRFFI